MIPSSDVHEPVISATELSTTEVTVHYSRVSGQFDYVDGPFPCVINPTHTGLTTAQTIRWSQEKSQLLLQLTAAHGAVLLRDFPLPTVEDFDALIESLGIENFPYKKSLSNAVRINRTERVFSANEAPSEVQIFFHHEMAQTPFFPEWIMFYCEIAAQAGGATPICRSDVLLDQLRKDCPQFVSDCEKYGLKYSNVMPDQDDQFSGMGRSWRSTLGVESIEEAEARLQDLNYTWEWLEHQSLRMTTPVLPAIRKLASGRTTFFNQLIAAFSGWKDTRNDPAKAIRHGNEQPLDQQAVQRAIEISEQITFDVAWQPGDAVLIDNQLVMHARRTFVGPRKIVASLGNMRTHQFESASN